MSVNNIDDGSSTPDTRVSPTQNTVQGTPERKNNKNIFLILLAALLALGVGIGGTVWFMSDGKKDDPLPKVKQLPDDWKGASIMVDNTDRSGNPLPIPVYDGSDPLDEDSIDNPQQYSEEKAASFKVPIVGECKVNNNVIEPPSNYLHGCWWQSPDGGIQYTGHSVRGPRVGAFEKLAELKVGEIVEISGVQYKIAKKMNVSNEKLPNFIMQDGVLSLVTCLTDPLVDEGGEFTRNVIMILENA